MCLSHALKVGALVSNVVEAIRREAVRSWSFLNVQAAVSNSNVVQLQMLSWRLVTRYRGARARTNAVGKSYTPSRVLNILYHQKVLLLHRTKAGS